MARTTRRPARALVVGGIVGSAIVSGITFAPLMGLLSLVTVAAWTGAVAIPVFAGFFWLAVVRRQDAYVAVAAVAGGVSAVIALFLSGMSLWWLAYSALAGAIGGGFGAAIGNIDEPTRE